MRGRGRLHTDSDYDDDEGGGGSARQRRMALTAEDRCADDTMLWFVFESGNYEKNIFIMVRAVLPVSSTLATLRAAVAGGPLCTPRYIKILCV